MFSTCPSLRPSRSSFCFPKTPRVSLRIVHQRAPQAFRQRRWSLGVCARVCERECVCMTPLFTVKIRVHSTWWILWCKHSRQAMGPYVKKSLKKKRTVCNHTVKFNSVVTLSQQKLKMKSDQSIHECWKGERGEQEISLLIVSSTGFSPDTLGSPYLHIWFAMQRGRPELKDSAGSAADSMCLHKLQSYQWLQQPRTWRGSGGDGNLWSVTANRAHTSPAHTNTEDSESTHPASVTINIDSANRTPSLAP